METVPQTRILKEAANYFTAARQNIYAGAALLYQIDKENAWEGAYNSFSEYVEQECQLSKGYASKLLQAYTYYVVENKVSPRNLEGIDHEKAYLAISLGGTAEQKLVKAQTWTRQELKDELAEKDGEDCKHETIIQLCAICHKRV